MHTWQNRPFYPVCPVLLVDAIVLTVRDGQVANGPVYVAIGITVHVHRDVLGSWAGPTSGEGGKQSMTKLTDLKNRGVADVLIARCDRLKGLLATITATRPEASVRARVVHSARNSLPYASKARWSKTTTNLKNVYGVTHHRYDRRNCIR